MKVFIKGTISTVVLIILTACGGGSSFSREANESIENNIPIVMISQKHGSVIEGMSVELNATAYDSDNDMLSYKWIQTSGEEVNLVNSNGLTPSFIAPEVTADSNVSFELSVDDGKATTSSKAMVTINIIDEPKVVKRHEVIPTTTIVSQSDKKVEVNYSYSKTPVTEITSGLVLNIYWDSSKIEYGKVENVVAKDYIGTTPVKDDSDNKDSNSDTDKYITLSWVNLENGNWQVTSPVMTLFTIEFKVINGSNDSTPINIKNSVASPGLKFYSKSVLVNLES